VQRARGAGPALDRPAYIRLRQQSQREPVASYRAVDPQLFNAIATGTLPPGPGPEPANPSHAGREVSTGGND
jgi:cytochrome o ubiquinol oxidase subunit 2